MRYDDYIPEIDYEALGYKAIKGRDEHFCTSCVNYYKMLYNKGVTKRKFPFRYQKENGKQVITCSFDKRADEDFIKRSEFDTDEDYEEAIKTVDPVRWAYAELNWKARWYQEEILRCTSQFKAIRAGRRVGKTASLSVISLWYALTNKNFEILVVCPFVAQVAKIMDNIRQLIDESPGVSNSVTRDIKSSPQIIAFANGSKIRGFAAGGSSSGRSDQIRGQDADLIVMDEVDYIADSDIEVIMAILTSNKYVKVIVSSTPRGLRSNLFEWSRDKDGRWKEFWYISAEGPAWDEETEEFYKQLYSGGGFSREFLAEFGEEMTGVFRGSDLQKCIYDYTYESCTPDNGNCIYTIGVDWNKHTGTHIVVVERPKEHGGKVFYKLVEKVIVRKSDFTQIEAVRKIQELDKKWGASFIYCDAGYGHTQIEMLWAEDLINPEKRYRARVKSIEMNSNTIIYDPIMKREIKKPTKPLMVYFAANQVEQHRVMFPKSEDTTTQIVPEELAVSNIGIIQQARSFMVERTSPTGREVFSQDYEHTLTAWMLAIMANLLEYGDYKKLKHDTYIGKTGPLGMGASTNQTDLRDAFGRKLPPAQVKNALERNRLIREQEEADRRAKLEESKRGSWKEEDSGNTLNGYLSDEPGKRSSVVRDSEGIYVSHRMGQALVAINGKKPKDARRENRWKRRSVNKRSRQSDFFGRKLRSSRFKRRDI